MKIFLFHQKTDKLLRLQGTLVDMKFWPKNLFYLKKDLLEKAPTLKRIEYSPLGKEWKTV